MGDHGTHASAGAQRQRFGDAEVAREARLAQRSGPSVHRQKGQIRRRLSEILDLTFVRECSRLNGISTRRGW